MLNLGLLESELVGKTFLKKIYYFRKLDSTNDFAKSLVDEDNVLVITDNQFKGRGRFERTWESDPGNNLTFSIRRNFDVDNSRAQSVNFFFSLYLLYAVRNYIREIEPGCTFDISIKWPNDIILDDKKLSGILIEREPLSNCFIIGIGLNVNQEVFISDYGFKTVSLKGFLNREIDIGSLLIHTMRTFDANLKLLDEGKYEEIFENWKTNTDIIGKRVLFKSIGNVERAGQVLDFTPDGGIKLKVDIGNVVYYSGDISITVGK